MAIVLREADISEILGKELNDAMLKAAEPILQQAMKDIEQEMRAKMASRLLAFIESNFAVERMGHDLRIVIKQCAPEHKERH